MNSLSFHIVNRGGIFLRYLILTTVFLIIGFVIKTDIQEGSLSHTSFYTQALCEEENVARVVRVKIAHGDTIYSLFAATPSPVEMAFPERLAQFYQLNPHLQQQSLIPGELIQLPIVETKKKQCKE